MPELSQKGVYDALGTVIDPELGIDIVSLGLIYGVTVYSVQSDSGEEQHVHILMTLTTPGCPLAGTFDGMLRDALQVIEGLDTRRQVDIELTFDPPWVPDMMSEEARAEIF
ncbi:DUF59 domain-containing protein [Candidatus Woesebacteria bacterium]|nr:DUF59 domain-containing protein [Candidatus Woesebacteria bacterium]